MEKNIKMTLETARKMYRDNDSVGVREWLLENFTQGELVGEVGKRWEECWEPGFYVENCPEISIKKCINFTIHNCFKDQFREKEQALSSLAFAQLSHIAAAVNKGKDMDKSYVYYTIVCSVPGFVGLLVKEVNYTENTHIRFNRIEDAKRSLVTNNELWRQYWML